MGRSNRQLVGVLDNIRSLYNVGSMFRTADAFKFNHLYLCGMTGAPDDERRKSRITKTSLGAEDSVPWTYAQDALAVMQQLKADSFTIIALEQTLQAESLFTLHHSLLTHQRYALVVGHEIYGIHADILSVVDQHLMIPMLGQKESLNVAVAFGIACAQLRNA